MNSITLNLHKLNQIEIDMKDVQKAYVSHCIFFLQVALVLAFCIAVIKVALTPTTPSFEIDGFYFHNANVHDVSAVFLLGVTNPNNGRRVLYSATRVALYKNQTRLIGETHLRGFRQDPKSKTLVEVEVGVRGSVMEKDVMKVVLEAHFRYESFLWKSRMRRLRFEAEFLVRNGRLVDHEGKDLDKMETKLVSSGKH